MVRGGLTLKTPATHSLVLPSPFVDAYLRSVHENSPNTLNLPDPPVGMAARLPKAQTCNGGAFVIVIVPQSGPPSRDGQYRPTFSALLLMHTVGVLQAYCRSVLLFRGGGDTRPCHLSVVLF